MQLSEFIEYLNFSRTLKATINKNTEVFSIQLLPEEDAAIREDTIYLTTDCKRAEKLVKTSRVKNILCLCNAEYARGVNDLKISPATNIIFADPSDMTDLFLMRSKLTEHMLSDLNEQVKLLEHLITSENMESLISDGAEYLGHDFMILDNAQNIVCSDFTRADCEKKVLDLIADAQPFKEQLGVEQFNSPDRATYIKEYADPEQKSHLLISQFTADGKVFGYLAVDHGDGQITMQDYYKASVMSSLACKLILSMDRVRNPINTYETLFIRLLEGNLTKETAEKDCKDLQWNVPENMRLLIARSEDGKDYPSILHPAMEKLIKSFRKAKGIVYTGRIVIFFEDAQLEEDTRRILENHQLYAAISQSFSDISQAREYYRQAENALNLARKLSLPQRVSRFEEMNLLFLLDNIGDPERLKQMVHPGIYRLLEADKDGTADLFNTFASYVECIGNINLVSEKLFVHRNTVKYRIAKVEELLGSDLKDPEGYQVFLLSFKIIEYLKQIHQW